MLSTTKYLIALFFTMTMTAPAETLTNQAIKNPIAIVIHGGAGTILREKMSDAVESQYRKKLTAALQAGHRVLSDGGNSTDAVIAAVEIMEDSPLFNAGHGAVFTHDGHVELDASIMRGHDLNAGAVTGIQRIKNPIRLAAAVMDHSPHVMLMGAGAEQFAKAQNFEFVANSYFHTDRRRSQLDKLLEKNDQVTSLSEEVDDPLNTGGSDSHEGQKFSTVGAVALDSAGNIAAATSTGGMTNKRFGRIGDSPIIGAGTYADNASCGISATGHGEYFIRAAVAHDICARSAYLNISLQDAADAVIQEKLVAMQAGGGIIGLDPSGSVVYSFNTAGMYRGHIDRDGNQAIAIFKE